MFEAAAAAEEEEGRSIQFNGKCRTIDRKIEKGIQRIQENHNAMRILEAVLYCFQ